MYICNSQQIPNNEPEVHAQLQVYVVTRNRSIKHQLHIPSSIDQNRIKQAQEEDVVLTEVRRWVDKCERSKDLQKLRLPPEQQAVERDRGGKISSSCSGNTKRDSVTPPSQFIDYHTSRY